MTVLSPAETDRLGGLPDQAIAGAFDGEGLSVDTFRPNPQFIEFMRRVIHRAGPEDLDLQAVPCVSSPAPSAHLPTLPGESSTGRAGPKDVLETLCLWLLLGISAYSLLLLALGALGLFHGPLLLMLAAVFLAAGVALWACPLWWVKKEGLPRPKAPSGPFFIATTWVFLPGLLMAVAVVYLPPGEFVLGGWDPGVYLNSGSALAASGGFVNRDALLLQAGPEAMRTFTIQQPGRHVGAQHAAPLQPGFYIDPGSAEVVSQFPFLATAWTAVGVLLGGPGGGPYVPVVISLVAVSCFFLLARRLLGPWGGLAAAALLAFNAVQVWHGRLSFSEELLQVFLFGGLWAGLKWREEGGYVAATAAGLALGLMSLVKPEGVIVALLALVALHFVPQPAMASRSRQAFRTSYLSVSLFAAAYWATVARTTIQDQLSISWAFAVLGAVLAAAAALVGFAFRAALAGRLVSLPLSQGRGLRKAALLFLAALGAVAALGAAYGEAGDAARSFGVSLWNGLFLSLADGLLLAAAPVLLFTRPSPRPSPGLLAVLGVLTAAGLLYLAIFLRYYQGQAAIPLFMWATRRLLPAVLPLLALLEAWALLSLAGRLRGGGWLVILGGLTLILATRWPDLAPVATVREYGGALQAVEELAAKTEPDAVLLMDSDDTGVRFAAPLRYVAGRASYVFWEPRPSTEGVDALVSSAQADGRPVYYLSSRPSGAARTLVNYRPAPVDRYAVALPELERISSSRPRLTNDFTAHFTLFRLGSRLTPAPQALPVAVDVGMEDFPGYTLLNDGFYLWEDLPDGTSFRWTGAAASLIIPPKTAPRFVALRAASGGPGREGSTAVKLSCGNQEWAWFQVGSQFDVYTFGLEGRCFTPGERTLTISADPWWPAEQGAGTDKRTLGIMLDWVRFY